MRSTTAPLSPASRKIPDLENRIERLKAYETWRPIEPVPFESIVGAAEYAEYWDLMDQSIDDLRRCHEVSVRLKVKIAEAHGVADPGPSRARMRCRLKIQLAPTSQATQTNADS